MRSGAVLIMLCGSIATTDAIAAEPPAREELLVTAPSRPPPLSLDKTTALDKVEITIAADELEIAPPSVKPPKPAAASSVEKEPVAAASEPGTRG